MQVHEFFIRRCYEIAAEAVRKGNHPFGALLVRNGQELLYAENTVTTDLDCTCHAELNLIRKAQLQLSKSELLAVTLYSSSEPCAMCAGAIYWAGIRSLVFGCSSKKLQSIAGSSMAVAAIEVFEGSAQKVSVVGPVLEALGCQQHIKFWQPAD